MNYTLPGPADAALELNASVTKTADYAGAWLDLGAGFEVGPIGTAAAALVNVTACDRASGDETYVFWLEECGPDASGAADSANATQIGAKYSVPVSGTTATLGMLIVKGIISKRFIRLQLDVSGTTPSITYQAGLTR